MKEYTKKPENQSRTLDSNPRASKQASISEILQAYRGDRMHGKPAQRQSTEEDEKLLQGKFESTPTIEQEPVQPEVKPNNTGLPDNLKAGIENLSGYSMDDVKVHYNSDKPTQLNALAYAQGTDIHVASGQENHLPHEAWHVVQQKQGRVQPTVQLQGVNVNDNEGLEREADSMGGILAKRRFNKIFNKDKSTDSLKNTDIYQRIQDADGTPIPLDDIKSSEECNVHIQRLKRIRVGHPKDNDNNFTYDSDDLKRLIARKKTLLTEEKEKRKRPLVDNLSSKHADLAKGTGWVNQPEWVGSNCSAGSNNEKSGGTVNTNDIDIITGLWQNFLVDTPYIRLHPRTGAKDDSRLVSADGSKSIRYGTHEKDSSVDNHHYHEETWSQAPDKSINIENKLRRIPIK